MICVLKEAFGKNKDEKSELYDDVLFNPSGLGNAAILAVTINQKVGTYLKSEQ